MVSVFGTMGADIAHVGLGIPYEVSTAVFAVALAVILIAWRRVEGTLSIHSIVTPRREMFYWMTVLTTFAFWFAYIVTCPVGASFADWFGAGPDRGGMSFGFGNISLLLRTAIAALVYFEARAVRSRTN